MVKRVACAFLFVAAGVCSVAQEGYTIVSSHFLPPEYYVGDVVELRIRLRTSGGLVPAEPSDLPQPGMITIRSVRVFPVAEEYDVRVSFSAYEPGPAVLPAVRLGDITLDSIGIETTSVLHDEGRSFAQSLGPLPLPGSSLLLALLIGALLIGPVAVVLAVTWLRRAVTAVRASIRERRPYRRLERVLAQLSEADTDEMPAREFYITLADAFRGYLTERTGHDFAAETAAEMSRTIALEWADVDDVARVAPLISDFDAYKFGGGNAPYARRRHDIESIRAAANSLEQERSG